MDRKLSIGFTGSQEGMSRRQRHVLNEIIAELMPTEFHHGDCIGADAKAHEIVRELAPECRIHAWPADIKGKRANCKADFIHTVQAPLARNDCIVEHASIIVACPKQPTEILRSGTWSTIRRAKRAGKHVFIIPPSGVVDWRETMVVQELF